VSTDGICDECEDTDRQQGDLISLLDTIGIEHKTKKWGRYTYRQQGDLISLLNITRTAQKTNNLMSLKNSRGQTQTDSNVIAYASFSFKIRNEAKRGIDLRGRRVIRGRWR
jgi:hypothetical protein